MASIYHDVMHYLIFSLAKINPICSQNLQPSAEVKRTPCRRAIFLIVNNRKVHDSIVQYSSVLYSAIQYRPLEYSRVQNNTSHSVLYSRVKYSKMK